MPSFKFPKPCRKFSKPFSSQTNSHLNNVGPLASLLDSRSVIRFVGPDTVKFLQGLLSNDVRKFGELVGERTSSLPTPNVSSVSIPPIYAAMLNPQGRFLYDFFIYRPSRPDEKFDGSGSRPGSDPGEMELLADVDASVMDEIVDTLKKYRLRSKVDIENVGKEFSCWQRYGGDMTNNSTSSSSSLEEEEVDSVGYGGGVDAAGVSASQGDDHGWQWYKDPRLDCLGFRGIFPSNTIPPLVEADKETDEKNFIVWRMERGVAEGSTEIPKGEAIPLEYNFSALNAISFDKGCYVGQELIARAHHRGVIRKRLFPLKFFDDTGKESGQSVGPGSEVIANGTGKKIGTVNTALGARGLGVLRLEEAFKSRDELSIKGQDVKVEVIRPHWWPSEWDMEHTQKTASALSE